MRPLLIDDATRTKLEQVKAHAAANPFSIDDMRELMTGRQVPAGDREGFSFEIPVGFRVVYTVEDHPSGRFKHISISVDDPKVAPSPEAVKYIMKEMGFEFSLEQCKVYIEEPIPAVNVLEPYDVAAFMEEEQNSISMRWNNEKKQLELVVDVPGAVLIQPNGDIKIIEPANQEHFTLEELQHFVGGEVQHVNMPRQVIVSDGKDVMTINQPICLMNEYGKINNLPRNEAATILYQDNLRSAFDDLYGPVVFCDKSLLR
jgi:hypothetical protein